MSLGSSPDSAGSVELPNAPNGDGWGGRIPIDLVCLHAQGTLMAIPGHTQSHCQVFHISLIELVLAVA